MLSPSWLSPAGPAASAIATLTWALVGVGAAVFVAVLAALAWALWRRGRRRADGAIPDAAIPDGSTEDGRPRGRRERRAVWLITAGAVGTTLVLAAVLVLNLRVLAAILPGAAPPALTVEIVGHQWWWTVRYPGATGEPAVDTANELRVPVGRRVAVTLASTDVIHSFWVPQLQGKLDLIPGKRNVTWIQADRPGVYRGPCAEFCGVQHANMALLVIAEPPERFEEWLRRERAPAAAPRDALAERGQRLFVDRGCASCHAIRGTPAFFGTAGPDLTHVASRRTLAAGTLTNVPGHLAGWIANPQALKPGNRMPQVPLEPEEFHAVVHYLRGLW